MKLVKQQRILLEEDKVTEHQPIIGSSSLELDEKIEEPIMPCFPNHIELSLCLFLLLKLSQPFSLIIREFSNKKDVAYFQRKMT